MWIDWVCNSYWLSWIRYLWPVKPWFRKALIFLLTPWRQEGLYSLFVCVFDVIESWDFPNKTCAWINRKTETGIHCSPCHFTNSLIFYGLKIQCRVWSLVFIWAIVLILYRIGVILKQVLHSQNLLCSHGGLPTLIAQLWIILLATPRWWYNFCLIRQRGGSSSHRLERFCWIFCFLNNRRGDLSNC